MSNAHPVLRPRPKPVATITSCCETAHNFATAVLIYPQNLSRVLISSWDGKPNSPFLSGAAVRKFRLPLPCRPTMTEDLPVQTLLASPKNVAFLLDRDLQFVDCSPAWDTFAAANGGRGISRREMQGRNILEFIPDVLRQFYEHRYRLARHTEIFDDFDYHCSSPEKIRLFRMSLRPVEEKLLVVNHLVLEEDCELRAPLTVREREEYVSAGHLLVLCANCRKAKRRNSPQAWTWVPEFLNAFELEVSHGLCPRCKQLLYGLGS